jgi:hypothetical protein
MRKILLVLIALAATALVDSRPSQAYEGRWCAVSSMGRGGVLENCGFNSFEACRMEVVAGNRGFCRDNARWPGWYSSYGAGPRKKARKRYRY